MRGRISFIIIAGLLIQLLIVGSVWSAETKLDDKQLTGVIESELWLDEAVSPNMIDVETESGVVTLSGSVPNILEKERSIKIARSTKGVFTVIDEMEVMDSGFSDNQVRKDIISALMLDPATESYEVDVEVNDGVAKLTGAVQSYAEKALCSMVTKGIKGVRDVNNEIEVEYKTDRPDREIRSDIEQRFEYDIRVNSPIDVQVSDGQVRLEGTVGSALEKDIAKTDAWVAGVKSVNTDGLEIEWWAKDDTWKEQVYANSSDERAKLAVESALSENPRTSMLPISVDVSDNIATLTGAVNNLKSKRVAEDLAENIVGIGRVENHIRVRTEQNLSDLGIADSIRDALSRDPYVSRHGIRILVENKKAYLDGSVDSYYEKDRAEDLASRVIGVAAIENDLNVSVEYDPYSKSDWEIKEDIESQLFWSPFVDSDDITVSVEDGIAKLTGVVSTIFEHKSAVENAREGGARNVVSKLYIKYGPNLTQPELDRPADEQ